MRNRNGIFGDSGGLTLRLSLVVMVVASLVWASSAQAQVDIDESTNDSFNTDVTIDAQSQECTAIVQQFNNAESGDAFSQDEAVAQTAAAVDAPVNVVQTCLQARGDIVIGSGDNDGNDDDNVSDGQDDGAVRNDSTSAAQDQYANSSGQEDSSSSCAVALDPRVTVAENGRGEETLNVASGQGGDYRVTYDLGDDTDSLEISLTSTDSGTATAPLTVTDDGSRIVDLDEGSYDVTVTPTPRDDGGYTVEVSRCGASSNDPDNTMNNTYDNGKQLANTGGPTETASFASPSAALIPVGIACVMSGLFAAAYLRNAANRR